MKFPGRWPQRRPHVQVVRVQPGDVIVYTHHSDEFDRDAMRNASDVLMECFPDNRTVAIAKGATVTVARPDGDPPRTAEPERRG